MDKLNQKNTVDTSRRKFVKKAAYIAPAIVTMTAMPAFASAGSGQSYNLIGNRPRP